jgi:hypothetical protein
MEIKIQKHIEDLRVKYIPVLNKFGEFKEVHDIKIADRIEIVSLFINVSVEELRTAQSKSINKIFDLICACLATYRKSKTGPPTSLIFDAPDPDRPGKTIKQKYNLIKDFTKLPVGWHIDCSRYDLKNEPARLAAMCYVEDGMSYAQQDQAKNILNKSADRMKIFEEQMQLNHWLDTNAFFLQSYVDWKGSSIRNDKRKKEIKDLLTKLNRLNGKMQSLRSQRNTKFPTTK